MLVPKHDRPPKVLSLAADVWSIGCVLAALMTGKSIFSHLTSLVTFFMLLPALPNYFSQARNVYRRHVVYLGPRLNSGS